MTLVATRRAGDLVDVACLLADEASALARAHSGVGHESSVAARAADHAREAAESARALAARGAPIEELIQAATWALSAAAVAITQAKLNAPQRQGL